MPVPGQCFLQQLGRCRLKNKGLEKQQLYSLHHMGNLIQFEVLEPKWKKQKLNIHLLHVPRSLYWCANLEPRSEREPFQPYPIPLRAPLWTPPSETEDDFHESSVTLGSHQSGEGDLFWPPHTPWTGSDSPDEHIPCNKHAPDERLPTQICQECALRWIYSLIHSSMWSRSGEWYARNHTDTRTHAQRSRTLQLAPDQMNQSSDSVTTNVHITWRKTGLKL